ncbi:MAG TPA: hypothetical protein VHB53_10690 [Solirubrobacterales bacterium]|nr:hypothetical protein [Solirubrobacterales bacterium]
MPTFDHLVGHRFPSGTFEVSPHRAWLWSHCVEAEPSFEHSHPSLAWFAAMRGCGVSIAEMLALFEPSPGADVVLGECDLELTEPLRVGTTYRIEAAVEKVVRKSGGSGVFDVIGVRIEVRDPTGALPFSMLNSMIVPRPEERP